MKHCLLVFSLLGATTIMAQPSIDVQAHRGGRGLMPENTIPAMLHAVDLGVHTLELDCLITADNQVVVSHDPFMNGNIMQKPDGSRIEKAAEKQYALYKMTYDSIRHFTEGLLPYPQFPQQVKMATYKPTLAALIDSVEAYVKLHHLKPVYYNIETKSTPAGDGIFHPAPEEFVQKLMAVITQKGITPRVTIQSFDPRTLQVLHRTHPRVTTALLVENKDGFEANITRLGFQPDIYSPAYKLVDSTLVKQVHDAGIKILPWTVNEIADIKAIAALGADGIISDYPDRLVQLFGSWQN